MRYGKHRPVILSNGLNNRLPGGRVHVIGRFIQNQKLGVLRKRERKLEARLLTARKMREWPGS